MRAVLEFLLGHSRLLAVVAGCGGRSLRSLVVVVDQCLRRPRPASRRPASGPARPGRRAGRRRSVVRTGRRRGTARPPGPRVRHRGRPPQLRPGRPTGAEHPASSSASRARSASTQARVRGSSSASRTHVGAGRVVGAALDRERALARGREHLERVEHLGGLVERGRAGPGRRGRARRRRARRRRPCRSGCRRCRGPRPARRRGRAPRSGRRGAGRRCRRGLPGGSSPRVSPSRATTTSRGSSRGGTAARAMPSAAAVGQVLERVHGDVDLAAQQRVAQRADEDAGAAELGERGAARASPSVRIGDQLGRRGRWRAVRASATRPLWVRARAEARVPMRMSTVGAHGRSTSARVTASTASGSRENSSASAAA